MTALCHWDPRRTHADSQILNKNNKISISDAIESAKQRLTSLATRPKRYTRKARVNRIFYRIMFYNMFFFLLGITVTSRQAQLRKKLEIAPEGQSTSY